MQPIPAQLVHMAYTKISNHNQTVRNAPLEATVQALKAVTGTCSAGYYC